MIGKTSTAPVPVNSDPATTNTGTATVAAPPASRAGGAPVPGTVAGSSKPKAAEPASAPRVNYLDWLRIFAVLLLIPFHSARVFDIFEPFYVKNAETGDWLSWVVICFLGQWQMPLLFLIAGASTWFALRKRSGGGYLRERLKRLMVPFIFGTLLIVPPQMYFALLHRASTSDSFLAYYPTFFQMRPAEQLTNDYAGVGFTWAHLWFILDLFVIAVIVLPLLLWLKKAAGQRLVSRLAGFFSRRGALLLPALIFPLTNDIPDVFGHPFIPYLLVFVFGFALVSDLRFARGLDRTKELALALGAVFMTILYVVWTSGVEFAADSFGEVLFSFVAPMNAWFWLMALLGFGQKYLNADNRLLRYARDAAYPFYLLHQTVIVAIAYFVVQWSLDLNLKYSLVVLGSLVTTVVLYDVCVKRINVTRWLFGMKSKPRPATAPTAPSLGRLSA